MLRPSANNLVYVDALHQCLCPRLASLARSQLIISTPRQRTKSSPKGNHRLLHSTTSTCQTQVRIRKHGVGGPENVKLSALRNDGSSFRPVQAPTLQKPNNGAPTIHFGRIGFGRTSAQTLQDMTPIPDDHGDAINGNPPTTSLSNPIYVKMIRRMLDLVNNGTTTEVFIHAKDMATKGYAPTLDAYTYLIQACAKPENGANLQEIALKLLQEMKDEGFQPTSRIYHNLLKILAHSPDYISLERILGEMKEAWIFVNPEGWQHVLLSLLATGQTERAMELFYERREKNEIINYNTYMEIIKALGRINEVEEALRVMHEFIKEWGSINKNAIKLAAWYELLSIAASNYHLEGVTYIWRKAVQAPTGLPLNPDDGLCLKVLNTAARHGSPKLALEVFRILSLHKMPYAEHHYAALIAAYARVSDLPSAFRTLALMRNQGVDPTPTTANSIVESLVSSGKVEDIDSAYFILKDFRDSSTDNVDISAFNAVLAACVKLNDLQRALGVYSDCATLGIRPNTETFNILFNGCVETCTPPEKRLAMFLANEMKEIGEVPDVTTYEELLRVSLYQEDYEDAFMYLEEMKEIVPGRLVRPMVYEWIAKRLEEKDDPRLKLLIEEMKHLGYEDYVAAWEGSRTRVAVQEEQQQAA